jgi:hypothetical protein
MTWSTKCEWDGNNLAAILAAANRPDVSPFEMLTAIAGPRKVVGGSKLFRHGGGATNSEAPLDPDRPWQDQPRGARTPRSPAT